MKKRTVKDLSRYTNEWVAIDRSKRKIIAHNSNFDKLWIELKQRVKNVSFYKVPPADSVYSP